MSLNRDEIIDLFRRTGAYLSGHFQLTSGLHSSEYLQCALVLQHPSHAETLGAALARELERTFGTQKPDLVVSPAIGGIVIGHEVGRALQSPAIFTERDSDKRMTLRRGFGLDPGQRAVVIEDVITTGGSTREVIELVRAAGGEVLAAGSIIDRSGGAADVGARRVALAELEVQAWAAGQCPLCAAGKPVQKPGSRPA